MIKGLTLVTFVAFIYYIWDKLKELNIYASPALKLKGEFYHGIEKLPNASEDFLQWFVGFVDGEGNFSIKWDKSKKAIGFRFKINLHKDDINTLIIIQEKLGVGRVKYEGENYVSNEITNFKDIQQVIIPIFDKYPLLTIKQLNYNKFKKAL